MVVKQVLWLQGGRVCEFKTLIKRNVFMVKSANGVEMHHKGV